MRSKRERENKLETPITLFHLIPKNVKDCLCIKVIKENKINNLNKLKQKKSSLFIYFEIIAAMRKNLKKKKIYTLLLNMVHVTIKTLGLFTKQER